MTKSFTPDQLRLNALRRRRLELVAVVVLSLFIVFSTWSQVSYFGTDSWVFLALLNVNIVLMLIVLFLVSRNVVKLMLERRAQIFGAKLRTRLFWAFLSVSLIPMVLVFLASNRVLNASVDYWFKNQVESSMEAALEVGQSFYNTAAQRLQANALQLRQEVRNLSTDEEPLDTLLARWKRDSNLTLAGFVARTSEGYEETLWHMDQVFSDVWRVGRVNVNWGNVDANGREILWWPAPSGDYVLAIVPVLPDPGLYLVIAESIGSGLIVRLDDISRGFEEYSRLKDLKRPLKISYSMILGLLSLTIVFGAIWVSFRLSRQITEPILALSRGTDQVARGDTDFTVEEAGKDELGQLVDSFNRMAKDVRQSHAHLTRANSLLEERGRILEERNNYIETVLDTIATGVITLDGSGRIATMNKAAAEIFHTTPEQWQGRSPTPLLQGEYAAVFQDMYAFLRTYPQRTWQRELEFVWRGRSWRLLIQAVSLPGSEGTHTAIPESVVAVIEDITELARMQRLAAWQEVAKRIAHEIKNPLTPIKLSAQRLERKFGEQVEDPAFSQCTSLIVREVDRLLRMVSEFSAFASLPEAQLTPGDIAPLLTELVDFFRASHSRIEWTLDMPVVLPLIRLDQEALHRALLNILSNAAEAVESMWQEGRVPHKGEGGQVSIRVRTERTPEGGPLVGQEVLTVDVEDSGPGLTEEDAKRMFEPYFSRKSGGTGLGLAIVRSIMRDHGAEIQAFNQPRGSGTVIRMEFPVA